MTFDAVLAQVLDLLQRQGRVSYRALKRRFDLDDAYLEDLKAEIIKAQRLAIDDDGEVLVWAGEVLAQAPRPTPPNPQPEKPPDPPTGQSTSRPDFSPPWTSRSHPTQITQKRACWPRRMGKQVRPRRGCACWPRRWRTWTAPGSVTV